MILAADFHVDFALDLMSSDKYPSKDPFFLFIDDYDDGSIKVQWLVFFINKKNWTQLEWQPSPYNGQIYNWRCMQVNWDIIYDFLN